MNDPKSRPFSVKRPMYFEKLISLLLLFKSQIHINLYAFYAIIIALFVVKHYKTGNTIGTVGLYIITLILMLGDALELKMDILVGILIIFNYFFVTPTLYSLPEYNPKVSLRENRSMLNNKELYWAEWSPVQQK